MKASMRHLTARLRIITITHITWLSFSLPLPLQASDSLAHNETCTILPYPVVEQSSSSDGVISNVAVVIGQSIHKGQLLAKLDDDVERATLDLAQQRLNAQRTLTPDNIENLKVLELELQLAQTKLEQKAIKASNSGVVSKIYTKAGERLNNTPLLQITQRDPLLASSHFPPPAIQALKPGQISDIYDQSGKLLGKAKLISINPQLTNQQTQEVVWEISNANTDADTDTDISNIKALPGQSCRLALSDEKPVITPTIKKVGPIYSAERKAQLVNALSQRNHSFTVEESIEKRELGYFILAYGGKDHQQTLAIIETLNDKGITDTQVLSQGDYAGHISLGLAYEMDKAEALQANLKSQGVETHIKPRIRRQKAWWLKIETNEVTNLLGGLLTTSNKPPSQ